MELIGKAEAPAQIEQIDARVAVGSDTADSSYADNSGVQIGEPAVAGAVDRLRKDDVPTHAVVQGELRRYAPGILRVKSAALLAIRCGLAVDIEALKLSHLPLKHRGDTGARARAVAERQQTGAIRVTRIPQIEGIAQIGAKPDRVIAEVPRPVVVELQHLFALLQRAVATLFAEVGDAAVGDVVSWRSGRIESTGIEIRKAVVESRCRSSVKLVFVNVIRKEAKTEVRHQLGV